MIKSKLKIASLSITLLAVTFYSMVKLVSYDPADVEPQAVIRTESAPMLQAGQSVKVLSWNVQFMAGKNYVFWFDLPAGDGPDVRPSAEDISLTINEVARVIIAEDPDIILLQEMDIGAARTDHEDQVVRLLSLLPDEYKCSTSAFYWKASYVPHPQVHGSVGLALAIISKFQITSAQRHQLALTPANWVYQQLNTKRAILEARLPVDNGETFIALNTHLEAFAQGSNTMQLQVAQVNALLTSLSDEGHAWVIGGDFNLLPPDSASYYRLPVAQQYYFEPHSEISVLFEKWQVVPGLPEISGPDYSKWFTHFPNDPEVRGPDRTIDYLFFDHSVPVGRHFIRQHDTQHISDHLPVVAEFRLPEFEPEGKERITRALADPGY